MRVALVHDYLIEFGGAERVLVALHRIWPQAPLFVALKDEKRMGSAWRYFASWKIIPSWFQKIPFASKLISPGRFLLPLIWESFDFSSFDLVISSSAWGISKGVITSPSTKHLCYCHTPPRFLYHYPESRPWHRYWPVKIYAALVNHRLRHYDYLTSQRVDLFVANSQEVANRINKFYQRKAVVIPPPVNLPPKNKVSRGQPHQPYLFISRLVSYKHPELALRACLRLKRPLIIAGSGPLLPLIRKEGEKSRLIKVLGRVSEKKLSQLYQQARALIFPAEKEDFGIVPLEAQGYGKPVIALSSGGVKETVIEGKTGLLFSRPTVSSLVEAIKRFEKEEARFQPEQIRAWAENFSPQEFEKKIKKTVRRLLKN